MATGLIALLDDIAGIAKVAAASVDDIAAHSAKASAKSAGVVIDYTAVTPRYVIGFAADRELPIVIKITRGSLRNKLLIQLPAAIASTALAPWGITPLLMLGGLYLCIRKARYCPHWEKSNPGWTSGSRWIQACTKSPSATRRITRSISPSRYAPIRATSSSSTISELAANGPRISAARSPNSRL